MKDYSNTPPSGFPNACKIVKREIFLAVSFATSDGVVQTLEGDMTYVAGDAIVTGCRGEQWPVQREKFIKTYVPSIENNSSPMALSDGYFTRKAQYLDGVQIHEPFFVKKAQGTLTGKAGDWLVQYFSGDLAIVELGLFYLYYEISDIKENDSRSE